MSSKVRYEIEFPINSSPQLLYQYISSPSGLQEWFADKVNSRGDFFTFEWNDSQEYARLASKKTGEKIKFKWVDENKKDTELLILPKKTSWMNPNNYGKIKFPI
jgi:uncharacterized protein YndB with AHSA1/START domain